MLLIYVPYKTNRIEYTWNFIFNEATKVPYVLTTSVEEFSAYNGSKFEYSNKKTQNGLWLWASNLLFENNITSEYKEKNCKDWGYVLFPTDNTDSLIPFDIPSAVFWLICRCEEYISENTPFDLHKRYDYRNSWLYSRNLLDKPIVNIWIIEFVNKIRTYFPALIVELPKYKFISTIDVDNMYACKGKSILQNLVGGVKSFFHQRINLAWNRITYFFTNKDLYDTYDEILIIHNNYRIKPVFFILTSKHTLYDRNLLPQNPYFKKTINILSENADFGIHFSYYSYEQNSYEWELNTLENLSKTKIIKNRFHYLRFRIPQYYQKIYECGILEDYSMLYAQIDGFRAGTCTPYYFFNLKSDEVTSLKIFSSPFMDKHLTKKWYNEKAYNIDKIFNYIQNIKKFGGTFVLLWHNETLFEKENFKNTNLDIYKTIIEYAIR